MNNKKDIFIFLRDLSENNSKEWMDQNRRRYLAVKEQWILEVEQILIRLAKHDPYFTQFTAKQTLMRINNDRKFHPNKPVYKDYFACSPMRKGDAFARIHISAGISWSFLGGGLWKPERTVLKQVRDAIDYDGDELVAIINHPQFVKVFGSLSEDPQKLKTSPRNYPKDHKHIELLRYNNLTAQATLTEEIVVSDGFVDYVEEVYVALKPLNNFFEKAISVR